MSHEKIISLAESLYDRLLIARGTTGVYYDSTGVFRMSPVTGIRYAHIAESFPDSIVGAYTNKVSFDDFFEDFDDFCKTMGAYSE